MGGGGKWNENNFREKKAKAGVKYPLGYILGNKKILVVSICQ
jgi:hypothetical protein